MGKIVYLAAFLIVALVLAILYFFVLNKFSYEALQQKPTYAGGIIKNPDINYDNFGYFKEEDAIRDKEAYLGKVYDWESDGYYDNSTLDGEKGFVLIHPYNDTIHTGRYIQQKALLENNKMYNLVLGIGNVAGKVSYARLDVEYAKVGFKAFVSDSNGKTLVFDKLITITKNDEKTWNYYSIDLGKRFSGEEVTIRIESYVPKGIWDAEYAAVNYIDVLPR